MRIYRSIQLILYFYFRKIRIKSKSPKEKKKIIFRIKIIKKYVLLLLLQKKERKPPNRGRGVKRYKIRIKIIRLFPFQMDIVNS